MFINFYGCVEQFIAHAEENCICHNPGLSSPEMFTYCVLLVEYLNDHYKPFDKKDKNQICGFDKDALNQLMNRIEITYHEHVGMCRTTLSKLKGGHNTKSTE